MSDEAVIPIEEIEERLASRRRLQPYDDYRDSGIDWIGSVPREWRPARMIDHIQLVNGYPFDSKLFSRDSGIPLVRIRDIRSDATEAFWTGDIVAEAAIDDGDVLVGMDGDFNVGWWRGGPAQLNQRVCCLRARSSLAQRYLYYLIPAPLRAINDVTYSTTVKHLSSFDVLKIRFAIPPIDEQRAIAAFLDRETARIDELIAKKQRLLELLAEKRTALISHAVTKGLNHDVPMKDSGVEWLGQVPEHWEVHHLRRVVDRFVDYRGRTPTKTDTGVPLITAGAVRDGTIDHSRAPEYMAEEDYHAWMCRGWPELGDVIITTEAPLAEVALIEDVDIALAQRVILFKVNPSRVRPEWLRYYYLSESGRSELLSRASGSTASGIRADRLRMSLVLIPPLEEQQAILEQVDSRVRSAAAPLVAIRSAIDRLHEYRSALISAAVTGKIDVRNEVET